MYTTQRNAYAFRIGEQRDGKEIGHAWLYLIYNDLHKDPYGLIEDVKVLEEYEGQGIGRNLLGAVIDMAKSYDCYKIIATSRDDGTRPKVHAWYERAGLIRYGLEFRMNLKEPMAA